MRLLILPTLCAALYACVPAGGEVTYTSGTYVSGGAYATTPDLVTVEPGVQVIADYDEPVFYTDGFYWRFYDGYWYRSGDYATGWVYYGAAPARLRVIDRPYAYAHYRPAGYVARSRAPYRPAAPIVRDHRDYNAQPAYRGPSEPAVRDHRSAPAPVYQPTAPAPVVRDHRTAPAPAPAPKPVVRDHRH